MGRFKLFFCIGIIFLTLFACSEESRVKSKFTKLVDKKLQIHQGLEMEKKDNPQCILLDFTRPDNVFLNDLPKGVLKHVPVSSYDADYYVLSGYKYDIKKTDSVVTPYKATVLFSGVYYGRTGTTLQDCKNSGWGIGSKFDESLSQTYAYQDGAWILKRIFAEDMDRLSKAASDDRERIAAEVEKIPLGYRRINKMGEMYGKSLLKFFRSKELLLRQVESWDKN